jgi:ribosomal protein L37AE/L43A
MTTKTDLQPCPFCGEVAFTSEVSGFWVAYCNAEDDDCSVNPETDLCDTEAEAINAWNPRPTDAIREAVEVLEDTIGFCQVATMIVGDEKDTWECVTCKTVTKKGKKLEHTNPKCIVTKINYLITKLTAGETP